MNILVPLNNKEYLQKYVDAGADELYIGFYDDEWFAKFGKYADINRMSGFKESANQYTFEQMIDICKKIKSQNKKAFVTMNANVYSQDEIEYIKEKYFPTFKEIKIDGLIVSDPNLAQIANANDIKTVASTMCAIYNSDIAKYYYDLGIKRMILPRDLSLDEIEEICKSNDNIEYEVFFMRNGCVFSDCYCLGMHRKECGSTCGFVKSHHKQIISTYSSFEDIQAIDINDYTYNKAFHHDACGMCALYRMKQMNISALKIVGRADMCESVCEDIKLTKKNIEIVEQCDFEEEYLKKMIMPSDCHEKCMMGFSCYYPEVRFK